MLPEVALLFVHGPPSPLRQMSARAPRSRFLALGQGNGSGYTSKPLREVPIVADDDEARDEAERVGEALCIRDEPEAIGPAILEDWAAVNRRIFTQQHLLDVIAARETRPLLNAEDRLKDIYRRAKHNHVDLSHEIHIMRRDLEKARARGRDAPAHTLDRLERVESLLDGVEL